MRKSLREFLKLCSKVQYVEENPGEDPDKPGQEPENPGDVPGDKPGDKPVNKPDNTDIKLTSITLGNKSLRIAAGKKIVIPVVTAPANATNPKVIFASSDEKVATVKK